MNQLVNISDKTTAEQKGFVWIVGAGPGDAELLTIKAYKALQAADIVLFDWLVDESVLDLIPKSTQTEFVGKRCGKHSMAQQDICKKMVFHALQGKNVVRLKGGDPAIFARTVEETQILSDNGIAFIIVPGVTAASGASAYSGIPLTHRDCAQSVTLTTASLQQQDDEPNWQNLVRTTNKAANLPEPQSLKQTLVFYMGLGKLQLIVERLIEHGLNASYPIAVIDNACTAKQTIIKGTLANILQNLAQKNITGPAIIICGEVVKHQQKVSHWAQNLSPEDLVKHSAISRINEIKLAI